MEIKRNHILSLEIDHQSDIGVCRRKATKLAEQLGFDKIKTEEIAILVTELATNVIKHGQSQGKLVISEYLNEFDQKAIEIWCCDSGEGIQDVSDSFKDGQSSTKTLGLGLGTIRRLSDQLEINSSKDEDIKDVFFSGPVQYTNCFRSIKWLPPKNWAGSNDQLISGAAARSKPGETLNGDSHLVNHVSSHITIASVIDGLGHGKEANWASQLAKEHILLKSELPLDHLMHHINQALRGTRGATVGLMKLNTEKQKLYYTGIGNIESFLMSGEKKNTLISYGGIVGHNMRSPRIFELDFKPGDTICMYSDGITSRWKPEDINWGEAPQQIAEHIINNYSRSNDDATVLIVNYTR